MHLLLYSLSQKKYFLDLVNIASKCCLFIGKTPCFNREAFLAEVSFANVPLIEKYPIWCL